MQVAVYLPFVLTAVVIGLSRAAAHRLPPRAAAWATSVAASAIAMSTVGALGLLSLPLIARLPLIAHLGRWHAHAVEVHTPVPAPLSFVALVALVVLAWRATSALRSLRGQFDEVVQAHAELDGFGERDVVVMEDTAPRAHAVSRTITRRGRVILTTAMLDLLDDEEAAAVVEHERSHVRHAHGVFLAVAQVAVALNPTLASMQRDVRFAIERWADEDAAEATSRPVTASALVKAALATLHVASARTAGFAALHLHSQAVTDRVAALLDTKPQRRVRLAWALICTATLATAALAWATHDTERFFETIREL